MTTETIKPPATDQPPIRFRLRTLLIGIAILGALLAAIVPAVRSGLNAIRRVECSMNPYHLSFALHNYHDTYGSFPPACTYDAKGKPAHSWRVLLLPFMDQAATFQRYNLAEPWNGPGNSTLATLDMPFYRCPADHSSSPRMTNYVAIVGPGTMWPANSTMKHTDIPDGPSQTIMVVEISNSDIHWMEPRDLPVEELEEWLDPDHKPRIFGNHIEGSVVAYADGSVKMLPRAVTIERLRAMITPAGKD